jgi:hypothetical protein
MPFHKFTESELRQICKEHIETLEYWLRRLIDKELSQLFGDKYYEAKYDGEHYLLNSKIRSDIAFRIEKEAAKFPRWIDATLIEHSIEIICNPNIYKPVFEKVFKDDFPLGNEHLRFYLGKIAKVRNTVYHANAISIRDAEQTICYTNDIIDSIKKYYIETNKQREFNVPTIIKYSDSLGSVDHLGENRPDFGIVLHKRHLALRSGDRISIEIEVDSTFPPSDYTIKWMVPYFDSTSFQNTNRITIEITDKHIGEHFYIQILVTSNKETWHRFTDFDDRLAIMFKVLPPI